MDILFEILFEVYGELMLLIVPEAGTSKRLLWLMRALAVLVLLGCFALAVWGFVLLLELHNLWGIAPIAAAALLSLSQITAGIVLYCRHQR